MSAANNPPTPPERRLLCLIARGQTLSEAAEALHLTSEEAKTMLTDLLRRQGLSEPRRLVARALVYRWI